MNESESKATPAENTGKKPLTVRRVLDILRFGLENLGPLLIFIGLSRFYGLKVAIAGAVIFVVLDVIRRKWMHLSFPMLYLVSSGLTVGFGLVDLLADSPFMLRFEPVISNLVTFGIFVFGAFGKTSLLQEIIEQKRGAPFVNRPDLQRFFSYLTLFWALYFLLKAILYLWIGMAFPLDRAVEIRSVFGTISLIAMIAISTTQTRRLYRLCQRFGWVPPQPE